jgi:predicted nucleotidyltransferase
MKKDTIETLKSIISEHEEIIAVDLYGSAACGAENPVGARFCGACGGRFGGD